MSKTFLQDTCNNRSRNRVICLVDAHRDWANYYLWVADGGCKMNEKDKEIMIEYLLLKVRQGDWHGVSDAANDIREMQALERRDQAFREGNKYK